MSSEGIRRCVGIAGIETFLTRYQRAGVAPMAYATSAPTLINYGCSGVFKV